jgi:hypothetical protein
MAPDAATADRQKARELARTRLEDLRRLLEAQPPSGAAGNALDLCGHLARAIDAFHMEAIRFRIYTLARLFGSGALDLPEPAHVALRDVQQALEAAGFHTRSIPH